MPPGDVWRNLKGTVATFFQFGIGRPAIKSLAGGQLEVRSSDDSAYANLRVATPSDDNDAVTKHYADKLEKPMIVSRQVDGDTTPTNTATRGHIIVNSNGTAADIGDVWFDDGSSSGNAELLTAVEGRTVAITDALTGGTVSWDADSIYIWDTDPATDVWVKIGDIGSLSGAIREIRYVIDNSATQDSTLAIPANNRIVFCSVEVTTSYSGGATISVGNTATADLFMGTTQNNPQAAPGNIYEVGQDTGQGGSATVVRTTVAAAPAAGAGVVVVRFCSPNA
jgi:hypothetical protein